ncbi:hypothetical protein LCGC14_0267670 [marine sediment metagenome]|uniref:Uncharacterized protein n=1 Tax=marine sediment metagenome TaxID=412755 RepID=A0A0F9WKP7_9ZZZZ
MSEKILHFRCVAGDCPAREVKLKVKVSIPPETKWINEKDLGDPKCPACDSKLDSYTNSDSNE